MSSRVLMKVRCAGKQGDICQRLFNCRLIKGVSFPSVVCIFTGMKKILIVLLVIVIIALGYLISAGLFKTVEIQLRPMPGYRVVGVEHIGPYEKIGDAFERIHAIADEQHVPVKMIGVYFDNPKTTAEDELHSLAGVVVSAEDSAKLAGMDGIMPLSIPAGNAAVSTFETNGMVSMIIGAIKSYPALTEYVETQQVADRVNFVYEVYGEGTTEYVMQLKD